jgi:hypothetical protein
MQRLEDEVKMWVTARPVPIQMSISHRFAYRDPDVFGLSIKPTWFVNESASTTKRACPDP